MTLPPWLHSLYDSLIHALFAVPACTRCPHRFLPLGQRTPPHSGGEPSPETPQPGSAAPRLASPSPCVARFSSFPVDVVYTWVDGADPQLAAQRAAYLPPQEKRSATGTGDALYRDNDELRYSLRSLEACAPWVRRIFIATDRQVPAWLNTAHPKIHIADHSEFIPEAFLPTFNSRVIEAHLHRIPGLAEHYLYCNDDFFLAAPRAPGDFFTPNGLPHIFIDWRTSRRRAYNKRNSPHARSHANARAWLRKKGIHPAPDIIAAHAPYPQTRTNADAAYTFFAEAIAASGHNKFRQPTEIAFNCHAASLFAYARKQAVPCDVPHTYINCKGFDCLPRYAALLRQKDSPFIPPFFCLNDVGDTAWQPGKRAGMAAFLEAFFPTPAPFEK